MKNLSMKSLRDGLVGFCLGLVVVNGTALATSFSEFIEVHYSGITVYIDGIKTPVKDSTGAETEPFIYNGTTYVPLAYISQSLGEPVQWDGATKSIYIGKTQGQNSYLFDVCPPYQINGLISGERDGSQIFSLAGKQYTNGYMTSSSTLLFNLDGKFDTLSFIYGHVDEEYNFSSKFSIYLDEKLVKQVDFTYDMMPETFNINLNGALQMKIVQSGIGGCDYAFGEMIIT